MPFIGQIVEIPIGTVGLSGSRNQSQISPGALLVANNLTYENGTIEKEGGTAKYNASAISGTPSILGGHDWNHDGSTQRMVVVTSAGAMLKDTGGGDFTVTLKSGLTVTTATDPVFVEGGKEVAANNRKLFTFLGGDQVQVLSADGATTSNLGTPPTDWGSIFPTFGFIHENRLWGGGNSNDAHRMYYSLATDHEDFTTSDAGSLAVFSGEGEKLVRGFSFKGFAIVFKYPTGIYSIDTTDPTIANWKVNRISGSIGCAGPAVVVNDDIIFLDQAGNLRLLSSTDEFGDVGTVALSDIQDANSWMADNLTFDNFAVWRSMYYPTKREYHLACTGIGATVNNTRLVIDLNGPSNARAIDAPITPRFRSSDRDSAVSMWIRDDGGTPNLVYGDDTGFVRKMDQAARTHDGSAYTGEFQTPYLDLSHADPMLGTKTKNFKFLEIVLEPQGNYNMAVDVLVDGATVQTVQFNLGTNQAALGSFVLDTDKLSEDAVANRRRRIIGSGR